ncbi:PTS system glucoside-specific EIICBA component [Trichinella spiralis]|uniref:PTS system glucoside-specific EIICBA component n=1 Tax=Trichinella spiralis TaxID=6334 RepID=A0ABR3KQ15_TRISP
MPGKFVNFICISFRIIAASLSAYLYESCWLSKDQLLGYLWALNSRHSKQLEPAALGTDLAISIFTPSLKPTCLHDVWFHTFWLSVIHYVLSLTKLTALDTHWQPHLHEHINGFFKFFVITICLYVKPGCRFAQRVHNEQSTHRTCTTHVE